MNDCYTVTSYAVDVILGLIRSRQIAIPEIQRPFVWPKTKVRDLIDSLYHGYPTGYLITWKNPDVKVKGGGTAQGKTVLIDGQQRITALMAALAGLPVLNSEYEAQSIKIAFNPLYEGDAAPFAVLTAVIKKDARWIPDISELFQPAFDSWSYVNDYIGRNPGCDPKLVNARIRDLLDVEKRQLGCIVVNADCSIDQVTDIFVRINSKGKALSQADFAMSKIAADEKRGGEALRKGIDYFCHLATKPEFWETISKSDPEYLKSVYANTGQWLRDYHCDIYAPNYNDVLRVAFMYRFSRGKLSDLVALLSGRDFEARDYKSEIADSSFCALQQGVLSFMRRGNFEDFIAALKAAGFSSQELMTSDSATNFSYNLYLRLRDDPSVPATQVKRWVQRWYVMSVLTGRYSSSSESVMDRDIRAIEQRGLPAVYGDIAAARLSDNFWDIELPQKLTTTNTRSGAWVVYVASQIQSADNTLFTHGFKVSDLVDSVGDKHHIFPRKYLERELAIPQSQRNQIANYAFVERRINIAIGDRAPKDYFSEAREACATGSAYFGDISDPEALERNLEANCIPSDIYQMGAEDYDRFLKERRELMASKIRTYFDGL